MVGCSVLVDGCGEVATTGVVDDGWAVTGCTFKSAFLDFLIALFLKSILRFNIFISFRPSLGVPSVAH